MTQLIELMKANNVDELFLDGNNSTQLKFADGSMHYPTKGQGLFMGLRSNGKFYPYISVYGVKTPYASVEITIPQNMLRFLQESAIEAWMESYPEAHPMDCCLTGVKLLLHRDRLIFAAEECGNTVKGIPAWQVELSPGSSRDIVIKSLKDIKVAASGNGAMIRCLMGGAFNWQVPITLGGTIKLGSKTEPDVENAIITMANSPRFMGEYYGAHPDILKRRIERLFTVGRQWADYRKEEYDDDLMDAVVEEAVNLFLGSRKFGRQETPDCV